MSKKWCKYLSCLPRSRPVYTERYFNYFLILGNFLFLFFFVKLRSYWSHRGHKECLLKISSVVTQTGLIRSGISPVISYIFLKMWFPVKTKYYSKNKKRRKSLKDVFHFMSFKTRLSKWKQWWFHENLGWIDLVLFFPKMKHLADSRSKLA